VVYRQEMDVVDASRSLQSIGVPRALPVRDIPARSLAVAIADQAWSHLTSIPEKSAEPGARAFFASVTSADALSSTGLPEGTPARILGPEPDSGGGAILVTWEFLVGFRRSSVARPD
jgi:hypothetical protein